MCSLKIKQLKELELTSTLTKKSHKNQNLWLFLSLTLKQTLIFVIISSISILLKMKGFGKLNHYDGFEVIERFNIDKNQSCEILVDWLDAQTTFSAFEQDLLQQIQSELVLHGRAWNEEELKINFIGFVFFLAKLNVPDKIQTFFERKMVGKVEEIPISVVVDGMVASPTKAGRPQVPYFFLQEAPSRPSPKGKERILRHDPEGQMLAAMILAQALNKDHKPLYGCWIQGKNWNFTTLINKNYCVSKQFDATDTEDLSQIVSILRKLKHLILNR